MHEVQIHVDETSMAAWCACGWSDTRRYLKPLDRAEVWAEFEQHASEAVAE